MKDESTILGGPGASATNAASLPAAVDRAMELAWSAGTLISFDPNVRLQLWSGAEECSGRLLSLLARANLVLLGHEDAEAPFRGELEHAVTDAALGCSRLRSSGAVVGSSSPDTTSVSSTSRSDVTLALLVDPRDEFLHLLRGIPEVLWRVIEPLADGPSLARLREDLVGERPGLRALEHRRDGLDRRGVERAHIGVGIGAAPKKQLGAFTRPRQQHDAAILRLQALRQAAAGGRGEAEGDAVTPVATAPEETGRARPGPWRRPPG